MKILLLNGPASSGKDTAARHLLANPDRFPGFKLVFDRFSFPHKRAFAAMTYSTIDEWGNVEPYESTKSDIIPWLGVSYRQWQIDFSEKYMKPYYGQSIFTRMFLDRTKIIFERVLRDTESLQHLNEVVFVIADCGFNIELTHLLEYIHPSHILLARLHRPGFDFTGDSRQYIYNDKVSSCDIENDKTLDTYYATIEKVVGLWLNRPS